MELAVWRVCVHHCIEPACSAGGMMALSTMAWNVYTLTLLEMLSAVLPVAPGPTLPCCLPRVPCAHWAWWALSSYVGTLTMAYTVLSSISITLCIC
jgi:hypothetical protein